MKQTLLTMVAAAICSLGLFSSAQAQVLAQDAPEIALQSYEEGYIDLASYAPAATKQITLPSPYFYVGYYVYPDSPAGSPSDIKVDGTLMSTAPLTVSYTGQEFWTTTRYYTLVIQAGTPGGSTVTEFRYIVRVWHA